MNALDSPLEAVAINYNLWTWVAVVTAALSFWRIRSAAYQVAELPPPPSPPHGEDKRSKESKSDGAEEVVKVPTATSFTLPAATVCVTKGRLTMYFLEDDQELEGGGSKEEAAVVEEVEVDGGCGGGELWCGWKKVMRERSGEMGWYRCQDLSALDGNVVQLWDDIRITRLIRVLETEQ